MEVISAFLNLLVFGTSNGPTQPYYSKRFVKKTSQIFLPWKTLNICTLNIILPKQIHLIEEINSTGKKIFLSLDRIVRDKLLQMNLSITHYLLFLHNCRISSQNREKRQAILFLLFITPDSG